MTMPRGVARLQPVERLIEEGLFRLNAEGQPQLIGSHCIACGAVFGGRRSVCLSCFARQLDEVLLGPRGTVHSFTVVHQQARNSLLQAPYTMVQVRLAEGVIVSAPLVDSAPDSVAIGMGVETRTLRFTEETGEVTVSFAFAPISPERGAKRT